MVEVPVATAVATPCDRGVGDGGHGGGGGGPGHLGGQVLGRVVGKRSRGGELLRHSRRDAGIGRGDRDRLSTAAVTVSKVEPLTLPSLALMVEVPVRTAVATPCDPEVFEMVATEVVAEAQVTWVVRSCVELSEYVPVAVNCSVNPTGTLGVGRRDRDRLRAPRHSPSAWLSR